MSALWVGDGILAIGGHTDDHEVLVLRHGSLWMAKEPGMFCEIGETLWKTSKGSSPSPTPV